MKIWVAGVQDGWSGTRMVSALSRLKVDTRLIELANCSLSLSDRAVRCGGDDLSSLDALVVRKLGEPTDPLTPYRVNLLRALESAGVRVFSPSEAIEEANDRYRMTLRLAAAGIPIPETVVTQSVEECIALVERWRQAVVKPLFTSKGRGMVLLDRDSAYRLTLKNLEHRNRFPFYIQRFVPASCDVGVALLGSTVLGAFKRVAAPGSWQTTIRTGGRYEPFAPDSTVSQIAAAAAAQFGLDYTVVDLVETNGEWLVYEVSAFGGFSGLWACGIDAATSLSHYVMTHLDRPSRKVLYAQYR